MNSLRRVSCVLLAVMFCIPMPGVMSNWIPVTMTPSGTVTFPEGGGNRTLNLTVPADGLVKGTVLNVTGMPAYFNHSWSGTDEELWAGAYKRDNLTISPDGIGLAGFGSWWEDSASGLSFSKGSFNATIFSPILNVSAYSRVMVESDFPNGTNYTVDILDPTANNATLQGRLRNGDELNLSLWAGLDLPYRDLVIRLIASTIDVNLTPTMIRWGVGTSSRISMNKILPPSPTVFNRLMNPVLGAGKAGEWDDGGMLSPAVVKVGAKYYMWYPAWNIAAGGHPNGIGLATSDDGINWQRYGANPVLSPGPTGNWDSWCVYEPMVIYDGTMFHMWYDGSAASPLTEIGYANSTDGINWKKYTGNPVLKVGPDKWDGRWLSDPYVLKINDTYFMWYTGDTTEFSYNNRVGLATSNNGIDWVKSKQNPVLDIGPTGSWDSYYASGPSIIYDNGIFHMWYHGYDDKYSASGTSIGYAYSMNGTNWSKLVNNPILSPRSNNWDSSFIYGPSVLFDGTNYLLWYTCVNKSTNKWLIGYAKSTHLLSSNFGYSNAHPFYSTYGNLYVNATTPPNTGYWVNVTDEKNNTLLSYLKNGDPILIDAIKYPRIQFNLTLWTVDPNETPIVHEWGYGSSLTEFNTVSSTKISRILAVCPESIIPSWSGVAPSNTSVSIKIRLSPNNITWSGWMNLTSGQVYHSSDFTKWGSYLQYNITLNTSDSNVTPFLSEFRIEYLPYLLNATLRSDVIIIATEGNIVATKAVMNCQIPSGLDLYLFLSADTGITWQRSGDDIWKDLPTKGSSLRGRVDFAGYGNGTPLLGGIAADYRTEHLPSDVSIDVGADGKDDWHYTGQFTGTAPVPNFTAVINAYIDIHRAEAVAGYLIVPVNITSRTGGIIILGDAAIDFFFSPHILAHSPIGTGVPLNTSITASFSERMNVGSLDISVVPTITPGYSWSLDQRNLTLSHPDFQENTTYFITIKAGVLSIDGAPLLEDYSWNFTTLSYAPLVIHHNPTGTEVPLDAMIMVSFNEPMRENSLDIVISPAMSLDSSWSMDQRKLNLTHPLFQQNTTYTVTVKAGALSIYWARLLEDYSWNFTTLNFNPIVLSHSPIGTDVPLDAPIVISFSEMMDRSSLTLFLEPSMALGYCWTADSTGLTLTHLPFQQNATYTVTVKAGVLSIYGAPILSDFPWTFTTLSYNPTVLSHSPTGTDVPLDASIVVSFSELMDRSSLRVLLDMPLTLDRSWNSNSTELSMAHPNFDDNTTYRVTVKAGALSIFGAPMLDDFSWTFTTLSIPIDAPNVIAYAPQGDRVSSKPTIMVCFDRGMDYTSVISSIHLDPDTGIVLSSWFHTVYNFTLSSELLRGTTYTVTVSTDAKSLQGKQLAVPFTWNFTTVPPEEVDSDLPTVLFTDPSNHALRVDNYQTVSIVFSEAMDKVFTLESFTISPSVNGTKTWLDNKGTVLQFQATGGFSNGTYRIVLLAALARDESGNLLDGNRNGVADGMVDDYVLDFSVGIVHVLMPKLISKSPEGEKVGFREPIVLTFNKKMNVTSVERAFSIDPHVAGYWQVDATGLNFTFTPTGNYKANTRYSVRLNWTASDVDGNLLDQDSQWTFTTSPKVVRENVHAFPWWLLILIAIIVVGAMAYWRLEREPEEELPPEPPAGTTAPAVEAEPIVVDASDLTEGKEAVAPAAAVTAVVPPPVPAGVGRKGSTVEDVFLMYRDGRLIQHATRTMKADMDVDVMTSMLKAVQDFVKDSIGMADGVELGSMEYGENKILLEKGKHVILAAVIQGPEPEGFRDELKATIGSIEAEYATILPDWDGSTSRFAGAKRFLSQVGAYQGSEMMTDVMETPKVMLKRELEFFQGFIRLKVAVKNSMPTMIARATFKLIYSESALRLDRIEPEFMRRGDEVTLGVVEPREKKTIAFYLDPQICTESYLEGVLTYKDAQGNLEMVKMPKKLISVVCPVLYSVENINTAMLKRMVDEELTQKDIKVFVIPHNITPQKAYDIAKAAIQHHDVRLVREFVEKGPFAGEAWYYGKAKGREDRVIIRARVVAEKNMLEFFVASGSTLLLTGMLAELKTDLNKELDIQKVRPQMRQVTKPAHVEPLAAMRTLLDKAAETESEAGEIEVKNP